MKKAEKKKNRFVNCIIVLCLSVCIVITMSVLWEYHRLDTVLPADILAALLGMWGGELLIIALRQVLGSDIVGQAKNRNTEE